MDKAIIQEILELGVMAPSGDNWQPWEFKVRENEIHIYNKPDDETVYNKLQWGSYIAYGALIENIIIASKCKGFEPVLNTADNLGSGNYIAKISLNPQAKDPKFDHECISITTRSTNRKNYKTQPLLVKESQKLLEMVKEFEPVELKVIQDRETIKTIAEAASTNEKLLFKNSSMHKLFLNSINWTKEEEEQRHKGLYIETLGISSMAKFFLRLTKKDFWFNLFGKLGLYNLVQILNYWTYTHSGNILIFSTQNFTYQNLLLIGRAMQKIWLNLTSMGYQSQPITAMLFLYYVGYEGKASELSNTEIEEVNRSFYQIKKINANHHPTFILRVGKADPPMAKSSRLQPIINWL